MFTKGHLLSKQDLYNVFCVRAGMLYSLENHDNFLTTAKIVQANCVYVASVQFFRLPVLLPI